MRRGSRPTSRIVVDEEVYPPSDDSFLLEDNMRVNAGSRVLDMGTGTGILAIDAALRGAREVVAVDINPLASRCAMRNAKSNGAKDQISLLISDMFNAIRRGVLFDLILFNPPYLRTRLSEYKAGWLAKAWAGGPSGRKMINDFIDALPLYLEASGVAIILHPSYGLRSTIRKLKEIGMVTQILASKRIFFESLNVLLIRFYRTSFRGSRSGSHEAVQHI